MGVTSEMMKVAFCYTGLYFHLGNDDWEEKLTLLETPLLAVFPEAKAYSLPTVDWG